MFGIMRALFIGLFVSLVSDMALAGGNKLAGSEWGPADYPKQFIRFGDEGRAFGSGGCNRFTGSYEISGTAGLQFGPLMSTKMACAGEIGQREMVFFGELERVRGFQRAAGQLTLTDAAGKVVMVLNHRDWD